MIHKNILITALREGEFKFSSGEHGNFILIPEKEWKNKLKDSQSD